MVISMFSRVYHLSLIKKKIQKSNICLASTASDRKDAKIQHDISWYYQNRVIFVLNLFNSQTRMTQKSSIVIFQALETSPASLNSAASATSLATTASKAQFYQKKKNFLVLMVWSSLATKWPILVIFLEWMIKNTIFHWYLVSSLSWMFS